MRVNMPYLIPVSLFFVLFCFINGYNASSSCNWFPCIDRVYLTWTCELKINSSTLSSFCQSILSQQQQNENKSSKEQLCSLEYSWRPTFHEWLICKKCFQWRSLISNQLLLYTLNSIVFQEKLLPVETSFKHLCFEEECLLCKENRGFGLSFWTLFSRSSKRSTREKGNLVYQERVLDWRGSMKGFIQLSETWKNSQWQTVKASSLGSSAGCWVYCC